MTRAWATFAALALGACAVGPDFEPPGAPAATTYAAPEDRAAAANVQLTPSASARSEWWTAFGSGELNALVGEAFAHNQTLAEANANLDQARAEASVTAGGALPQVNAQSSAVRERINTQAFGFTGFPSPTISLYSLGGGVAFDLDPFGGRRRAVERDVAYAAAQQARVDAAYLTISGNVVQQAMLIAGLEEKQAAQSDIIAGDQQILDMVRRAIRAGGQPPAAANTIEAQLAEDQAALPPLRQQLAQARHRLALYLGRTPSDGTEGQLLLAALQIPSNIPVSLPSELVRRRPDILAAEADLHAATANIGVETAALYPSISLNASLTQGAIDPDQIFSSASTGWSVGPSLTAPIFHGGALRAQVHAANATQRAALAKYQQTVLEAFVQVSDTMQAIANNQDLVAIQHRAVDTANANVRDSRFAYDNGAGTLLSLVDAQRQATRARLAEVDARIAYDQSIAALYVATAADWRAAPP
ncbi:MAG: efflux transporter outer membrane subunit [Pseudomonadota bacterium]